MRKLKCFIYLVCFCTLNIVAKNPPIGYSATEINVSQQTGKVTGTVSDDLGPVTGATVIVKGTTRGDVTDVNGKFTLDVKKGEVIVVSFLGYITQEIVITANNNFRLH